MTDIETTKGAIKAMLLFVILGPLIGASPFTFLALLQNSEGTWGVWAFVLLAGFYIGALPALFSGILFVVFVRQKIRSGSGHLSKKRLGTYGCLAGGLASVTLAVFSGISPLLFAGAFLGAVSGAVCAALCTPLTRKWTAMPNIAHQ
jgi:hypothetical protein